MLDQVIDRFEPSPGFVSIMTEARPAVTLALDVGTSGARAALFDDQGKEIEGAAVRILANSQPASDFSFLNPDDTVSLVVEVIDALLAQPSQSSVKVGNIAISCFWHSLVGIDASGTPTTPVLGWAQRGGAKAVSELQSRFDEREIHSRTGCRFHPSYWTVKLLQLRDAEPEIFKRTRLWLSFSEYLTLRLFGETATSISMASGTGCFNQRKCTWDLELLEALDLSVASFPRIATLNQTFNGLVENYSRRWPQLSEARVHPAIGDGAANNIGSGCTTSKYLALMIGTSGAMRVLYKGIPPPEIPSELWCYRAGRDRVVLGGALSDGGGLYRWINESLHFRGSSEEIESELRQLEPDAHELTILPFWAGERSTGWSVDARGAIIGLTLRTRPADILRAAMEAVAYRFALIAQALEKFAADASVIVSGNALRSSPVWVQIVADVLGRQITLSGSAEASTRGAALLALEATGKIQSIEEFSAVVETVIEPDMSHHARYQEGLKRQQNFYQKVLS